MTTENPTSNFNKENYFSKEKQHAIIQEVRSRKPGEKIADVMHRHGRTAQTYYNWVARHSKKKTPKNVASPVPASAKRAQTEKLAGHRVLEGLLLPEGKRVRIVFNASAGCPIVLSA